MESQCNICGVNSKERVSGGLKRFKVDKLGGGLVQVVANWLVDLRECKPR